jgi:DNA replication and repair protein RecF
MALSILQLQNFRSYKSHTFHFSEKTTVIVGPNTAGKTNLIESIYITSTGKSFKADKLMEVLSFEEQIGRIKAKVITDEETILEVVVTDGVSGMPQKRYLVNGVPKHRVDFEGRLPSVIFSPVDVDIIVDGPSLRRNFLDEVLEQVDRDYRLALASYVRALRQRNALLGTVLLK